MKKVILLLVSIIIVTADYGFAIDNDQNNPVYREIIGTACMVSTIEMIFFAEANRETKAGERLLESSVGPSGNLQYFRIEKSNGFVCSVIVGQKMICERNDDKFLYKLSEMRNSPMDTIMEAMKTKDGGVLPLVSIRLPHRGVQYDKKETMVKVSLADYSLTADCAEQEILSVKLPKEDKLENVVKKITTSKFRNNLKFPPKKDMTIKPEMPYTDLGDLLNVLIGRKGYATATVK